MGLFTILAIVLAIWGVITLVRGQADARTSGHADARTSGQADDEIDYEELRRAEEEVRDIDVNARPEDGFDGDDWGPGTPQRH